MNRVLLVTAIASIFYLVSCGDDDSAPANIEPIAAFTVDNVTPSVGVALSFTDQSLDTDGTIAGWSWNFGNGETSIDQNPSTTYEEAGDYVVSLTVTDDDGATHESSQSITVIDGVLAMFSQEAIVDTISNQSIIFGEVATDSIFFVDMEIQFTDASVAAIGTITSYSWDFGDGTTSNEQNPKHTFTSSPQSFIVTLTATNSEGISASTSKKIHIAGLKWTAFTSGMETNSPSVDDDGNIYFGDRGNGTIYKLNKDDGSVMWSFESGGRVRGSIAITDDNQTAYVGSEADMFYSLNTSSGDVNWSVAVNGNIDKSSPCIDNSGNVYVGTDNGILYSWDASGNERWTFNGGHTDGNIESSPLYFDSKVFIAIDSMLYAVNTADGTQAWAYETDGDRFEGNFAIDDAGVLYGGAEVTEDGFEFDGVVFALNATNGTEIWAAQITGEEVRANSPILGPNGVLYHNTEPDEDQQAQYARDASSGATLWEFREATDDYKVAPTLGASGILYVGNNDDFLYLLDSETGAMILRVLYQENSVSNPPAIGPDGTIYYGNRGDLFFAFKALDNETLASGGWPIVGGSNKHQNRK
ncbi:MAG: PQQ-binding-like beta-propeller repeat protein [Bacteroidota bacterium]